MPIQYPVRVVQNPGAPLAHIRDALDRVIAGGMNSEDAHEIVAKLNQAAAPRSRVRKQKIEEQLRASDLTAQTAGRTDIEYGHHESLPRGEHVARIGRTKS